MTEPDLSRVASAIAADRQLRLHHSVGAGAFKETFLAEDARGQRFALKVFRHAIPSAREAREIDALRRCQHPHIVRLEDIGALMVDGHEHRFLIERYVEGGSLAQRLMSRGLLPPQEALALGGQLIGALAHLDELGLVHRDLKPDNIMLESDSTTPVIVDFGLVRDLVADSLTQSHILQGPGTPLFAAPEQLRNEKMLIDWRTDQFALGVALAIGLWGLHPYAESDADAATTILERVIDRHDPSARFRAAAVAIGLSALVQMVAPWPIQRFRRPERLAEAWARQECTV